MTAASLSGHWNIYLESIREHGHQLLAWSYADIRSRINCDTQEPVITGLLCEAMKARINSHSTPEVYAHYAVGDQDPISPAGELGNDRLRLDVHILGTGIRPQLGYVFEAKRLRTGGFPIGKYAGDEGMGDFIAGRYARGCPEGAMIGFWQDKDAAYWIAELHRVFAEDVSAVAPRLAIRSTPRAVRVHASLLDEFRGEHGRSDGTELVLFHVFLDAC
jgi:hypothetical protein